MPEFKLKANGMHDAGAYAQCSCGVYSLDWKSLGTGGVAQPDYPGCGEHNHWSGSFKPPGPGAKFHPAGENPYDTQGADFPVCPHCGDLDQDWWDGLAYDDQKNDGDEWDVECPFCGEPYIVTMCVTTTFDTEKKPPAPECKTIVHCCADPRYFERIPDADMRLAMSDTLKTCTLAELRAQLRKDGDAGIVYPVGEPCEGFDPKTGCPGHKVEL